MAADQTTLTLVSIHYRGRNHTKLMEGRRFTELVHSDYALFPRSKTKVVVDRDAYDKWVRSIVPPGEGYIPGGSRF